jgi:hypothetical protein
MDPGLRRDDGQDRAHRTLLQKDQRGWSPSGAAEHRSHFGIERAALFELDLLAARRGKSSEFGERPKW